MSTILLFSPAKILAEGNDMTAEQIVQECERKTGFKATDRGARAFIFRRCVQTIQTEHTQKERGEIKALHRQNLQQRGGAAFDRRGRGDRTLQRQYRPKKSTGIQRVYKDQTKFQSVQFNRGRAPDAPESPEDQKLQRAQVDTAMGRYERKKLAEACGSLSGLRQQICMRSKLQEGSPPQRTKPPRQKE